MDPTAVSILAKTAALWFPNDARRLGETDCRLAGKRPVTPADSPTRAIELLHWRNDLGDAQKVAIRRAVFGE